MKAVCALLMVLAGSVVVGTQDMPPPGSGSWVVRVTTTGGFTGAGLGDYTVTSAGQVTCAGIRCVESLTLDSLQRLSSLVLAAQRGSWAALTGVSCSDCYRIRLVLVRRESGDVLRTYTAEWDEPVTTPPDLADLYRDLVRVLRSPATNPSR